LDYEERIEDAIGYILEHLDEPIDPRELADHVCFSRFHFHRVFQALAGETVGDLLRRLRLERAAARLRNGRASITELALEAGYATHPAFVRAFRAAYGCTPSEIRHRNVDCYRLPTPNGVHYGDRLRIRFAPPLGEMTMNVEIRELEPRKAVCMPHQGYYHMIGQTCMKLGGWL
jgi:AraC family transcriptional regulator